MPNQTVCPSCGWSFASEEADEPEAPEGPDQADEAEGETESPLETLRSLKRPILLIFLWPVLFILGMLILFVLAWVIRGLIR